MPGMKPVRHVRKRDGRLVEFDESRIADAIYKAALSVGGEDRFLAEELASVVTLFLEKQFPRRPPSIEDIQDMVEKVLMETGHVATAKAYILYREERARQREAARRPAAPAQRSLFERGPIGVIDAVRERAFPFDRETLRRELERAERLPEEEAERVAEAVADRVYALGRRTITTGLIDRLIDAELVNRGLVGALERRVRGSVDRRAVESSLFPKGPHRHGPPEERLAGGILRQFALEEIYPEEVAAAHLAGRIHLDGLEKPAAVLAAAFSPDALRIGGIPGRTGRFRPEAVGTPRRLAGWLGRAVRALAPHVVSGVALCRWNILAAPVLSGLSYDELREEAWHLLTELAEVRGGEIELALSPPPILAARMVREADGTVGEKTYARFTGTSLQLARALLEVRGTGPGLGPRSSLPRLTLALGPEALEEAAAAAVVERALTEALDREPVLLVLDREALPLVGTAAVRIRLEDAARLTDTARLAAVVGARAVVNLRRAALRAGPGNRGGFLEEVAAAGELALRGIEARRAFLVRAAAGPDGPLAPLARRRGGSPPLLDLARATHSLGVTGLNEAVEIAGGEELHESDRALKLGLQALGVLTGACEACRARGIPVDADAVEEASIERRFARLDEEAHPGLAEGRRGRGSPGVALREGAPVDLAVRLEMEGRLALPLRTTTVRCLVGEEERPAAGSLLALLRKMWTNTRIRQVLVGRRERR